MNVTVIGANGKTGDQLVRQLLAANHEVTAFVRDPKKLKDLAERVTIVQGDARKVDALERAVNGSQAVLSALGPRSFGKDNLQEVFMTNLVAAMEQAHVSRLIMLSAWGVGDSAATVPIAMKLAGKTILKNVFEDKARGEAAIAASSLDYTFVRPGKLTDGPAVGQIKAVTDGKAIGHAISRADVAAFMLAQLGSADWSRRGVIIGYEA